MGEVQIFTDQEFLEFFSFLFVDAKMHQIFFQIFPKISIKGCHFFASLSEQLGTINRSLPKKILQV